MATETLKIKGSDTRLYVGTAGWSYDDWSGIVYPDDRSKDFRGLQYLVEELDFNTVELNNTFYHPPKPQYCEKWLEDVRSCSGFKFTAKLWKRFTHERDEMWEKGEVEVFREGIAPLVDAGKMGALLVQFPWSFRFKPESMHWMAHVVDEFRDLPIVVELRSTGWLEDRGLRFLQELGVGFCNIDQPSFRNNIPLTAHGFGSIGYMRLHGRNRDAWFDDESGRNERYDYLYSPEELAGIEDAIEKTAEQVQNMFVITNNHYQGQAPANAAQLKSLLTGEQISVPDRLAENVKGIES